MYNEKNKNTTSSGNESESPSTSQTVNEINQNPVRVVTNFEEERCRFHNFQLFNIKLLINSGVEMNIIQITPLEGQIVVNEHEKHIIKGITKIPILYTIETAITSMKINNVNVFLKFDVFGEFPTNEAGIIGRNVLKQNKVILD